MRLLDSRWNSWKKSKEVLKKSMESILYDLQALETVQGDSSGGWFFGDGPPKTPPEGAEDTGGEDGGTGIREVIGEKYLFSYSEEDFKEALARAVQLHE